jgi:hypothetical protein
MPEISLQRQKGRQFGIGGKERSVRFSVDSKVSVIELLFSFYDPDFIPPAVTIHFLTGEGWQSQTLATDTLGLSPVRPKYWDEPRFSGSSYGETIASLYQYLLSLQKKPQQEPVLRITREALLAEMAGQPS